MGFIGMLYGDTWSDFMEYNRIYNQQHMIYIYDIRIYIYTHIYIGVSEYGVNILPAV